VNGCAGREWLNLYSCGRKRKKKWEGRIVRVGNKKKDVELQSPLDFFC